MPEPTADPAEMSARQMLLRVGGFAAVLLAGVFVVGTVFREPLSAAGDALVHAAGLPGLAALVVACDPLPGLGFQPGLLLGTAAAVPAWALFLITAASSSASSAAGWFLGHHGKNNDVLRRFLHTTGALGAVSKWGARAVALASVTPLPYGLATVAAGLTGLPFRVFFVASLARWVKIFLSLLAIQAGWNLGG